MKWLVVRIGLAPILNRFHYLALVGRKSRSTDHEVIGDQWVYNTAGDHNLGPKTW